MSYIDDYLNAIIGRGNDVAECLVRRAVVHEMGYIIDSQTYVRNDARMALKELRETLLARVDDVGLIRESEILESLSTKSITQHWPQFRSHLQLYTLNEFLALRNTTKARAKAALMSLGRAATKQEIAKKSGLSISQTSGALSNLQSVVRASKDSWGMTEWVEDAYDGIVGEIIQRIEADGESTSIDRLMQELPAKFGVRASSVRAFIQTPKFKINGDSVSLANKCSVQLKPLQDVIHGYDEDGMPYWTFSVEARYFNGYSVLGLPPEFAVALGCEPDGSTTVEVANLTQCRDLSVSWPLTSTGGASLGYVGEPLKQLGIQPGQVARIVIQDRNRVTLSKHKEIEESANNQTDEFIRRMKRRRRVFHS